MHVRTTTSHVGDHPVLAIDGIADLAAAPLLHDRLQRAVAEHAGAVLVVDLDGVSALDDVVLGLLLGAAATAREQGGDLVVVCRASRVRARLLATRFDLAVTVRDSIV